MSSVLFINNKATGFSIANHEGSPCNLPGGDADLTKNVNTIGLSSVCNLVYRDKVRYPSAKKLSDTIWKGTTVLISYGLVPEAAISFKHNDVTSYARLSAFWIVVFPTLGPITTL
ncbi:hypothetical protein AVEN_14138-1 [Araneus ventricosus]|uniref:Uncharacterized protein n=1 Tax=Araneus ventricosus TaxID=182803 RepID=A0A4Y2FVY4_ARAVE|nr:hypothetical protein AVEN_14138-1 [Araneus ventricosus]